MFGFGIWELLIILAIVLLIFGGRRLPQLGDSLGRAMGELNRDRGAGESSGDVKKDASGETARSKEESGINPVSALSELNRLRGPSGKLRLADRVWRMLK